MKATYSFTVVRSDNDVCYLEIESFSITRAWNYAAIDAMTFCEPGTGHYVKSIAYTGQHNPQPVKDYNHDH